MVRKIYLWFSVIVAVAVGSGCSEQPRESIVYPSELLPVPVADREAATNQALLLEYGFDAFSARVRLLRAAETSVDMQYYIWHPDYAGRILMHEVLQAAERGVTVRLLVDGMGRKIVSRAYGHWRCTIISRCRYLMTLAVV